MITGTILEPLLKEPVFQKPPDRIIPNNANETDFKQIIQELREHEALSVYVEFLELIDRNDKAREHKKLQFFKEVILAIAFLKLNVEFVHYALYYWNEDNEIFNKHNKNIFQRARDRGRALLRAHNHVPFHPTGIVQLKLFQTASGEEKKELIKREVMLNCVDVVMSYEEALNYIKDLCENEKTREQGYQLLEVFLNKINPPTDKHSCINARAGNAFHYVHKKRLGLGTKTENLNDLVAEFFYDPLKEESDSSAFVNETAPKKIKENYIKLYLFFYKKINKNVSGYFIKGLDGKVKEEHKLTWELIKKYFEETFGYELDLIQFKQILLKYAVKNCRKKRVSVPKFNRVYYNFDTKEEGKHFLKIFKMHMEDLDPNFAGITVDENNEMSGYSGYSFFLTETQDAILQSLAVFAGKDKDNKLKSLLDKFNKICPNPQNDLDTYRKLHSCFHTEVSKQKITWKSFLIH